MNETERNGVRFGSYHVVLTYNLHRLMHTYNTNTCPIDTKSRWMNDYTPWNIRPSDRVKNWSDDRSTFYINFCSFESISYLIIVEWIRNEWTNAHRECSVYRNLFRIKMESNESNDEARKAEAKEIGKKLIYCNSYPRQHTKSMKIAALGTIRCDTLRIHCKSDRVKYEAELIKQMYCTNAIFNNINTTQQEKTTNKRDDVAPHKKGNTNTRHPCT